MYCNTIRRIAVRFARISFLVLFAAIAGPPKAPAQWAIVQVMAPPPAMPYYEQPAMPAAGYIWTPGYWAWDNGDYYWVPGTWVLPPAAGLLWTPGYWIWRNNLYYWNQGYWGQHVGFYGGVNYGYGYTGSGYAGGYWNGGDFTYNSTVNNFGNAGVANSYEQPVVEGNATNVSFNGGAGGTTAVPNQEELQASHERHMVGTVEQMQHQFAASTITELRASANGGNPPVAATMYAAHFRGPGVTGTHPGHGWPSVGQFQHRQPPWAGGAAGHNTGIIGQFQHQQPPWTSGTAVHNPGGSFQQNPPVTGGAAWGRTPPGSSFRPNFNPRPNSFGGARFSGGSFSGAASRGGSRHR